MELTYVGGHDAVQVRIPDWPVEPEVARGESYDFPDEIAELLLEQPSNWQRTEPEVPLAERYAKARSHADYDAIAGELGVTFDDGATVATKKAALEAAVAAAEADDDAGDAGEEQH